MTPRKPPVHDARTTPDGLVACCDRDPRLVGLLTDEPDRVTCPGNPDTTTEKAKD